METLNLERREWCRKRKERKFPQTLNKEDWCLTAFIQVREQTDWFTMDVILAGRFPHSAAC
jgi:hypothetical protein